MQMRVKKWKKKLIKRLLILEIDLLKLNNLFKNIKSKIKEI